MGNKVTVKKFDTVIGRTVMDDINYEHRNINISISCITNHGFELSIFDKSSNIMRYYNIMSGEPILTSKENTITGDEIMSRNDIKEKILKLLYAKYNHYYVTVSEDNNLQKTLNLDGVDITDFATTLEKEFELEEIEFSDIMEWQTIKDIINYIEDQLEEKQPPASERW